MGDNHLHLHQHGPFTGDGPEPGVYPDGYIESYVAKVAARGIDELCFTEHLYRCVESAPALGRFWEREMMTELSEQTERFVREDRTLSLERYVQAVVGAKDSGLPVLLGLEVDFFPETIGEVLELIEPYPWDLLIGSVHWIGGWSLDHPEAVHEFMRRGVRQAYEDYFSIEAQLAGSGSVDVLAHVDLVKVLGHRLDTPPLEMYHKVVEGASRSGTAVEINTSGLEAPIGEMYPSPAFLEMFHAAGVPITLGSDAHRPEDAGRGLDSAIALARDVGYETQLRFQDRVPTEVML